MPQFMVSGSKMMKDGHIHTVAEIAPSMVKAEWTAAHYVASGYTVTIEEKN